MRKLLFPTILLLTLLVSGCAVGHKVSLVPEKAPDSTPLSKSIGRAKDGVQRAQKELQSAQVGQPLTTQQKTDAQSALTYTWDALTNAQSQLGWYTNEVAKGYGELNDAKIVITNQATTIKERDATIIEVKAKDERDSKVGELYLMIFSIGAGVAAAIYFSADLEKMTSSLPMPFNYVSVAAPFILFAVAFSTAYAGQLVVAHYIGDHFLKYIPLPH